MLINAIFCSELTELIKNKNIEKKDNKKYFIKK